MSCATGTLRRLKRFLPLSILRIFYSSLILPYLNYGIALWGSNHKRIFKIQKCAVRTISNSKYNAHTDPIFRFYFLLKVTDLHRLNILKLYYKYKHFQLPAYFVNMFESTPLDHTYNTRNRNQPRFNTANTTSANVAMRFVVPSIISETPPCIIDKIYTHSICGYSSYIKKFLCNNYEETCSIPNCYICNFI